MNTRIPPFDNVNVRRAVAFALPYDDMFKAALFGRGAPHREQFNPPTKFARTDQPRRARASDLRSGRLASTDTGGVRE